MVRYLPKIRSRVTANENESIELEFVVSQDSGSVAYRVMTPDEAMELAHALEDAALIAEGYPPKYATD